MVGIKANIVERLLWVRHCFVFYSVVSSWLYIVITFATFEKILIVCWGKKTFFKLTDFNLRIITLKYCNSFAIHQHEPAIGIHVCPPYWNPLPPHCIPLCCPRVLALGAPLHAIQLLYFTYGNTYVSMLSSQIIPLSPSATESKRLFFTSVSPLLPYM